jgi:hypothetical protein
MSALPPKADMFSVEIDVCFVPIADIRGQEGPLATPLVTSLVAAISTGPLRETRSLDAVAGFLPVKRWVKKSPDGTTGLVSNMASCPMAGPDPKEPRKWPSLGRSP